MGITVGRAHQENIHRCAIPEECLQYISREHFRIGCSNSGTFIFTCLTTNSVLRFREGDVNVQITKGESTDLVHLDEVGILTGEVNGAPTCGIRWLFLEACKSSLSNGGANNEV